MSDHSGGPPEGGHYARLRRFLCADSFGCAFAPSQAPAFTFGNAPRTDPNVRTPPRNKLDIVFAKQIKTSGSTSGEFRVELLNATGIPQYQAIPATFGIGTFGQVRNLAGYMRVTALTFRFRF